MIHRPHHRSAALVALLAALLAPAAARAQDAGDAVDAADDDAFEHRLVAYDPQRSEGYGGCAVEGRAPDAPRAALAAAVALTMVAVRRRRRA